MPPAWRALQDVWDWMDSRADQQADESFVVVDDDKLVANRHPWWEDLVVYLAEKEGRMNLS